MHLGHQYTDIIQSSFCQLLDFERRTVSNAHPTPMLIAILEAPRGVNQQFYYLHTSSFGKITIATVNRVFDKIETKTVFLIG
uniref:Uncharacterized protein n=1 Tax=Tolypothrix bouteillei VB521301 TaxID=1479485 RepID=A0A0C1QPE1_9CYAN